MEAVGYIHFLWSTLLQILVCVFLIFRVLGPSALAGLAFMIVRSAAPPCPSNARLGLHAARTHDLTLVVPSSSQPAHHGLGLGADPTGPDPGHEAQGRADEHRVGGATGARRVKSLYPRIA